MNTVLKNGEKWFDTAGNLIHAHGGGIIKKDDTYYWYGEDRRDNIYISCYASKDLMNWEFRNHLITTNSKTENIGISDDLNLINDGTKINLERPKMIYSEKLGKYVLWIHYENGKNYLQAAIAVATCDTPDGDFTYHGYYNPMGEMSRDCTIFIDRNGKPYFASAAVDNADLHIYSMTDDCLKADKLVNVLFPGKFREAPAFFDSGDEIYLLTSQCTNWCPNQCGWSKSKTVEGKWQDNAVFGDDTTYRTQPAFVLTLDIAGKKQFVYVGDRWGGSNWDLDLDHFQYMESCYYFAPISVDANGDFVFEECNSFKFDMNGEGFIKVD